MELAKGGELFDKLLEEGCLSEPVAARIMTQVTWHTATVREGNIANLETLPGAGGCA